MTSAVCCVRRGASKSWCGHMHASADTSLAQVIWTDSSQVICFVLVLCALSCVCSAARNTDDRLSAEGLVSRPALPLLKDRRFWCKPAHRLSHHCPPSSVCKKTSVTEARNSDSQLLIRAVKSTQKFYLSESTDTQWNFKVQVSGKKHTWVKVKK